MLRCQRLLLAWFESAVGVFWKRLWDPESCVYVTWGLGIAVGKETTSPREGRSGLGKGLWQERGMRCFNWLGIVLFRTTC